MNTPPLAATIVAVGRSSAVNPEPFAVTFTDKNWLFSSCVTTLPEKPVPFRSEVTDIVSLLLTNKSFGTPVNTMLAIPVYAGNTSNSSPFWYCVFKAVVAPLSAVFK